MRTGLLLRQTSCHTYDPPLTEAAQSPTVHRDDDADHDNDADDGAAWVDRLRTGRRLREVTGVDDNNDDDDDDNDPTTV